MWYAIKRATLGLALGALAVGATGCATTPNEGQNIAYSEPDAAGTQPPRANTIYGMTRLMRAQGNSDQAELALIGLMKQYPNYSPAYNDLAEIRIEQGRLEEAIHYVERGLEVAPNDAVLLNNAGVCALIKNDYAKALGYFQRALDLAPYESRYRANVALATGLTGDLETSRTLYQQIVSAEAAEHNIALIKATIAPTTVASPAPETAPPAPFNFALLAPQELAGPAPEPIAQEEPIAVPQPATEEEILLTPAPEAAAPAEPVVVEPQPEIEPQAAPKVEVVEPATFSNQDIAPSEEATPDQEPINPNI